MIPTVLERGGEYFRELWKSLSDRDRNLLQRLIQGETPAPQDKAVLRKLERKEIVEKTESGYSFQVPLVQNYVEQLIEEEDWAIAYEQQGLDADSSFLQSNWVGWLPHPTCRNVLCTLKYRKLSYWVYRRNARELAMNCQVEM